MPEKAKQQEMEGIDNTPLAEAVSKAVEINEQVEQLEAKLKHQHEVIFEEMKKIGKNDMYARGFWFRIKVTPGKVRLAMTRG